MTGSFEGIFAGLDDDIKKSLAAQLRNLWTHTSTAIEGNTLTLGETAFVIEEELTVSGKPLKDHQEVIGHARAIDIIYSLLNRGSIIREEDLHALHKAVLAESVADIYNPVGAWKKEPNGSYAVINGKQVYIEYVYPEDVPHLMGRWMNMLNDAMMSQLSNNEAIKRYAKLQISFLKIHPYLDGNGRVARLISNMPVLNSGYPPVIIDREKRKEYIDLLVNYGRAAGIMKRDSPLVADNAEFLKFEDFCRSLWDLSIEIVNSAHLAQQARDRARGL